MIGIALGCFAVHATSRKGAWVGSARVGNKRQSASQVDEILLWLLFS
jgi:hypothetical protein